MDIVQNVSTKGQIVIPKKIRESIGINQDSKVIIRLSPNKNIIEIIPYTQLVSELKGSMSNVTTKTAWKLKDEAKSEDKQYEKNKDKKLYSR